MEISAQRTISHDTEEELLRSLTLSQKPSLLLLDYLGDPIA